MPSTKRTKLAIPAKAARILRKVIAYIKEEPNRFRMDMFHSFQKFADIGEKLDIDLGEGFSTEQSVPPCRTMACIAGSCLIATPEGRKLLPKPNVVQIEGKTYKQFDVASGRLEADKQAAQLLGITDEQAKNLFFLKSWKNSWKKVAKDDDADDGKVEWLGWPEKFEDAYNKAKSARGRANVAIRRIEHFIQTGE